MSNEEIEKRMEFIIEHQAQFAVDIEKLKERQDKTSEDIEKLKETAKVIAEATLANTAMIGKVLGSLEALAQAQKRTDEKMAETSERLNSLINVVERHINEGHKRKSRG